MSIMMQELAGRFLQDGYLDEGFEEEQDITDVLSDAWFEIVLEYKPLNAADDNVWLSEQNYSDVSLVVIVSDPILAYTVKETKSIILPKDCILLFHDYWAGATVKAITLAELTEFNVLNVRTQYSYSVADVFGDNISQFIYEGDKYDCTLQR